MQQISIKKNLKREITFYCEDIIEEQLIFPILERFKKNDYQTSISRNLEKKSEIGFYCCPSTHVNKVNSKLSIICLGGMDQGKLFWPNFWVKEPWNKFDIGLLPGRHWGEMWKQSSWYKGSRPKLSICITGWPKTQSIKNKKFSLKNKNYFNVLYAPCFENDQKGIDIINAVKDLKIKLHIKHLPWNLKWEKIRFKDIRSNICQMIKYSRKNLKNFEIHNSRKNIFDIFNLVDLLITDESSLIYESLLFDVPILSCSDWKMRSSNSGKSRNVKQDKNICIYAERKNLKFKLEDLINNYDKFKNNIHLKKNEYFSNLDNSIDKIYELIDTIIKENKINNFEKPLYNINFIKSHFSDMKFKLKKLIS